MNNYTDLVAAVAAWTHRSDLTTQMDNFIALAEVEFNRRLRCRDMESAIASTALVNGAFALPADFLAMKYLQADTSPPATLTVTTAEFLADQAVLADAPICYAITGSDVVCWPSGGSVKGVYYARIPTLSSGSPTNWLMTKYPDAYLFGVLTQAAVWMRDAALDAMAAQRTSGILDAINSDSRSSAISGGQLTVRVR